MTSRRKIRLFAGTSVISTESRKKDLELLNIFGYYSGVISDNASSADNQQERPTFMWESSETICRMSWVENEYLASFLGFLYTDGCLSPKYKNSWRIYFGVKSKKLAEHFCNVSAKLFLISADRLKIRLTGRGIYTVVINSKEIGNFLYSNFGTFRTLKYSNGAITAADLPSSYLIDRSCIESFLRSAFTCDGGVCFYPVTSKKHGTRWLNRNVFLACSHPVLRKSYKRLLEILGISSTNNVVDERIKISSREDIVKFRNRIGFLEGVEVTCHSRKWKNVPKTEVLDLLIDSYGNTAKYLNQLQRQ